MQSSVSTLRSSARVARAVTRRAAAAPARLAQPRLERTLALSAASARAGGGRRPEHVGILAMETYFPKQFVSQEALEEADGVSKGKYVVGLGQQRMAFPAGDREDINSICLNAVARLLEKYNIDPNSVGRLEVGTETLVDKSKSTKTVLMQLFPGNTNIEGVSVVNACYGGTASLLNSLAWVESSEWDGRYAIMVCGDLALYEKGNARPTGGCGAVACLIGPDAPLAAIPGTRTTHATDVYDFYKPKMTTEYPLVDGALSQTCYLEAVDACYSGTMSKLEKATGEQFATVADAFDSVCFHSPYNKLVQQSIRRFLFNDALRVFRRGGTPFGAKFASVKEWVEAVASKDPSAAATAYARTLSEDWRALDKGLTAVEDDVYERVVRATDYACKNTGNCYTASAYANLAALVDAKGAALERKRVGLFSYGSGAVATMLAFQGRKPTDAASAFTLDRMQKSVQLRRTLDELRMEAPVQRFLDAMDTREKTYGVAPLQPSWPVEDLAPGAFYLARVDEKHRRFYERRN